MKQKQATMKLKQATKQHSDSLKMGVATYTSWVALLSLVILKLIAFTPPTGIL
jgi:hypothetical protein